MAYDLCMRHINQTDAQKINLELLNNYNYNIEQLIELAGLSCAHAMQKCFPLDSECASKPNVLFYIGPGNNGANGLVTARHLTLMGYNVDIYYPVKTDTNLYNNLFAQCQLFHCNEVTSLLSNVEINVKYTLIVDALFGICFKPPIRNEYIRLMNVLYTTTVPIASIDVPSGWCVDNGPVSKAYIKPMLLISVVVPKLCVKYFGGQYHYLGGRFVPPALAKKYNLNLVYPGNETCVWIFD